MNNVPAENILLWGKSAHEIFNQEDSMTNLCHGVEVPQCAAADELTSFSKSVEVPSSSIKDQLLDQDQIFLTHIFRGASVALTVVAIIGFVGWLRSNQSVPSNAEAKDVVINPSSSLRSHHKFWSGSIVKAVDVVSDQGHRDYQEDEYVFAKTKGEDRFFFGVYDGHGGGKVSAHVRDHLHERILLDKKLATHDYGSLMKSKFKDLDAEMYNKRLDSGSTAITALVEKDKIRVAFVGDSEGAMMDTDGNVTSLGEPHKPNRPDERERIESLGGRVLNVHGCHRVNGKLAVGRAFGDFDLKTWVSVEPEIVELKIRGNESFIVLASDGVWDVVNKSRACKIIQDHVNTQVAHGKEPSKGAAATLVNEALRKKSKDNITVVVVFFKPPKSKKSK